jgi:voltage-gated potassium channel
MGANGSPLTGGLAGLLSDGGDDAAVLAVLASLSVTGNGGETSYDAWKKSLKSTIANDPFDALVVTVLGGSFLFYLAEKGKNPKVRSYVDALLFVSTCLSVGYADVFAVTPAGKAIASAVMTFGPAMSGAVLESPKGEGSEGSTTSPELLAVQRTIVDKLDAILGELRVSRTAGG